MRGPIRLQTIAIDGAYVSVLGAILVVLGGVLPVWSVYHRTQSTAVRLEFVGGQLRPAMIALPAMADGTTLAIAESEITQSHFYHVIGGTPRHVAHPKAGSWRACPVPFNPDTFHMPVSCVVPADAAIYANGLTEFENRARAIKRETPLTPCYAGASIRADPSCTGYRLPTVEEWNYATKNNAYSDEHAERCRFAHMSGCPEAESGPRRSKQLLPSPWFLYDMMGNVAEIAISEVDDVVRAEVLGGSWREQLTVQRKPFTNPATDTGFRILRKLSN